MDRAFFPREIIFPQKTVSNMLFEMNENPKVIQAILGHKDVRTTITVYNSVDQDYISKSTDKLNAQFKV